MDGSLVRPTRRNVLAGTAALAVPASVVRAIAAETVDIEAAKKEGKVVLYTSAPAGAAQNVATAFQEKYGIQVELFRSGGTQVLRRFMMEKQAGASATDVLVSSDPAAMIDLAAKGMFEPFKPDGFEQVPAAFREEAANYVPQRVSLISIYGRTDLVPESEMPKTWDDLLRPRLKGKIVITNPSFTSLQLGVVAMMAKQRGWSYFEKLNDNDVVVVQGNEQALNMLKTGERAVAAFADSQYANAARLAGHPIKTHFPAEGTFAIPAVTAVVRGARNPNAARLLAAYHLMLEAQKLWPPSGVYAARADVEPPDGSVPISSVNILPMDYAHITASSAAVKKRFSEIFSV